MNKFILAAGEFTHLDFHSDIVTLKMILWGLYAGFLIAIIVSFFRKVYLAKLVRKLLKAEALSQDSALTLGEAGVRPSPFYKNALKNGGSLRKYISLTDDVPIEEITVSRGKQRIRSFFGLEKNPSYYDFSAIRLYIPEELKYKADVDFEKQGSPAMLIILAAVLTAFTVGLSFLIPELLTMLDNFLKIIFANQ